MTIAFTITKATRDFEKATCSLIGTKAIMEKIQEKRRKDEWVTMDEAPLGSKRCLGKERVWASRYKRLCSWEHYESREESIG